MRIVDGRLIPFSSRRPRTSSGQFIETVQVYPSAGEFVGMVEANPNFNIVIFESQDQLQASETFRSHVQDAVNICESPASCPALVRTEIAEEKREAVQQVFRAITEKQTP